MLGLFAGGSPLDFLPIVFIAGFVALFVVLAIASAHFAKKRREAIEAFAKAKGLTFISEKRHDLDERYPSFECLRRGKNRYAYNRLEGAWRGRPMLAFDYHYETESKDSKGKRRTSHHHFTAAILTPDLPLKPLAIRPEGLFDRVGAFFGWDDIDFESAEFSRRFHVNSPDRKWAYDVIHARAMERLLAGPRVSVAFDERHAIVWNGSTMGVEDLAAAADLVSDLFDMLPDYVVEQQRETA